MPASSKEQVKSEAGARLRKRQAPLGLRPFSTVHLLIALALLIFVTPFIDQPPFGELIEGIALTVVLAAATLAIGGHRRTRLLAIGLCIPAIVAKWLEHFQPPLVPDFLVPAAGIVIVAFVIVQLLRYIVLAPRVNREVVCAAISSYVLLGILWTFSYLMVSTLSPNAFAEFGQPVARIQSFEAFYFSFITLISIGYGDITPLSNVAKMLSVVEGMAGTFYVVILIARLIAAYSPGSPGAPGAPGESKNARQRELEFT